MMVSHYILMSYLRPLPGITFHIAQRGNSLPPLNSRHAACLCHAMIFVQKTAKNFTKIVKTSKMIEIHYRIWIHHEKCVKINTNIQGIDSIISWNGFLNERIFRKQSPYCMIKPIAIFLWVRYHGIVYPYLPAGHTWLNYYSI